MTTWPRDRGQVGDIGAERSRIAGPLAPLRPALRRLRWRAWAGSGAVAPLAAVALALLVSAWGYYIRFGFDHRPWGVGGRVSAVQVWLAFNDVGYRWAERMGAQADAVALNGYDGQFYYYLARDPGVMLACARGPAGCPIDASPLREERILYPMTARLLALGDPEALHVALFAINVAAILLTALLVGQLCMMAGGSRWLGAAAALYVGELQGLQRDLADPYAVFWTVLAVYFLRKDRPLWCAAAVAAAALTREQLIFVLPLLVLPWVARRRWGTVALFLGIALGPFVTWQAALKAIFGHWGLEGSFATTHGVHLPFAGLWAQRGGIEFGDMVIFVAVPLVGAMLVALAWVWRRGPRALLVDPVPLVVLLNGTLATLTAAHEWEGTWASARLVAPVVVLAVVVACDLAPLPRRAYAVLAGATVLATFVIPPLLF